MKQQLVLIGGGGHCKACIDVIEHEGKYAIAGVVDIQERLSEKVLGYEIIATDDDLPALVRQYGRFLITLGQIRDPDRRIALFGRLLDLNAILPTILSPLAYVSRHAKVEEGTIVMHHAIVNAGARIGKNCIINTKALIEHDAIIGDHCHVSTGAVINGGVRIGRGTFFGSNATSRESIEIGEKCVVGAGGLVERDLPSHERFRHHHAT